MTKVTQVTTVALATKPFIIGKEWLHSTDGQHLGRAVLSRNLPCQIVLRYKDKEVVLGAGSVINRFPNTKRADKPKDADVSLSLTLPANIVDELVALQRATA